jgi:hypothetical protein
MLIVTYVLIFLACLAFSAIVAYQAARRGYSFVIWILAGLLGNPIFFLMLLAIMPDYARKAQRRKEMADLEAKLAARPKVLPPPREPTQDMPLAGKPTATFSRERSLGDQPTLLPREHSLGDEETRG